MRANARTLFDEIRYLIDGQGEVDNDDPLLLIEVSSTVIDVISLRLTNFNTFAVTTRFPRQRVQSTPATIADDLRQVFSTSVPVRQKHRLAFVMGEFAQVQAVGQFLVERLQVECFIVDLHPGDITEMPLYSDIQGYISNQTGISRHRLDLVCLSINDGMENERRQFLNRVFTPVYDIDTSVNPGDTICEVRLYAPVLNEPVHVFFREMPRSGNKPTRVVMYRVIPTEREFYAFIIFNGESWEAEWDGAVSNERPQIFADVPEEIGSRWRVDMKTVRPKVLFVIEGALGMHRLLSRIEKTEELPTIEDKTDFAIVKEFVKWVVDTLAISQAEFAIMFYNDYHPEQPVPFEFRDPDYNPEKYRVKNESQILTFIPANQLNAAREPDFVDALQMLERIEQDFMEHQTITSDWYKSLEHAAHFVNHFDWRGADHVMIWIGQSSPHHHENNVNELKNYIGFSSKYNFMQEITDTHRTGVFNHPRHIGFFLSGDIPLDSLRRESRNYWRQIGLENHTFELRLARSEDLDDYKIGDTIINTLQNLSRDLLTVNIVRSATENEIDLPFGFLQENIQFQPKAPSAKK